MTKSGIFAGIAFFLAASLVSLPCAFSATTLESDRQSLRSPANMGGPENWPEDQGLSTSSSGGMPADRQFSDFSPAPAEDFSPPPPQTAETAQMDGQEVPGQPDANFEDGGHAVSGTRAEGNIGLPLNQENTAPESPVAEKEVIYVDEQGNPVPKPLEPENMFREAGELMEQGKFDDALPVLEQIKEIPNLDPELRENVLYAISDCLWGRYANNPLAGYEPIISSTNEAMNANIRSKRVPDALLRLGLANVNIGNLEDAGGYIVALMRRFPDYPGVAQGFTALGAAQLKNGKNNEAEQSFGIVLDRYPESSQLQDASVGLAHALVNQGKDERAQVILDFISKRWPRYYINDPDFLLMHAANEEKFKRNDEAMDLHWLYVNLDPTHKGNDELLLKMGDEYMAKGDKNAANFVYNGIEQDFPDTPAAVTASLRLAEKGIYDSPISYDRMSRAFSETPGPELWRLYNKLAESSQTGEDEVLARLKQAMWLYWDKQYPEAMGKASEFIDAYPEHPDIPEARDVLWRSFQQELEQSLKERNYGRILLLWNGFPYIRDRYGKMDPPLRYALSQGWLERGDEQKSFELLTDFLKDPMDPLYGEAAFTQFFNHYLQKGAWDKLLDLGNLVKNWKLKPELKNQLDYALALSAQNLNLGAAALNRWKDLASRSDIPLYQQAYATYFLAKDAEQKRDIRNAYERNRKVVEMFSKLSDERSDKADPERIKEGISALMDICEVGNRIPEALEWVERYNKFVGPDSPEYPGLRFREARLYRKLGDSARAQALLENVASKYPDSPFSQAAAAELRTFDVSRDLERFISGTPEPEDSSAKGTTSGNWSSSGPT